MAKPIIAKNAQKYLLECLKTGWISSKGPFIPRFEEAFAHFVGTKYAVATNSGTAAVHLALAALDIGPGDEVIVPALTMVAAVLPVVYVGATPVLVDVDDTGNIDPEKIYAKLSNKTKAIIVVHLNGHPANLTPIMRIAGKHKLFVVEDAAEAHGAEYRISDGKWQKVGSIGDVGCFSLYANKVITSGEGGMVTTSNKRLADRIDSLRNLARSPKKHFFHKEIAFTYRMSNLEAALGLAQLEEVELFLQKKRRLASVYKKRLGKINVLKLPVQKSYARRIYWNYDVLISKNARINAGTLAKYLEKHGVETRGFVIPLHKQPALRSIGFFKKGRYPVAEDIARQGLSLPLGLAMKDSEVRFVCHLIKKALG